MVAPNTGLAATLLRLAGAGRRSRRRTWPTSRRAGATARRRPPRASPTPRASPASSITAGRRSTLSASDRLPLHPRAAPRAVRPRGRSAAAREPAAGRAGRSTRPCGARSEQRIEALLARRRASRPLDVDAETRAQIEALGYVVPKGKARRRTARIPRTCTALADIGYQALALLFATQVRRSASGSRRRASRSCRTAASSTTSSRGSTSRRTARGGAAARPRGGAPESELGRLPGAGRLRCTCCSAICPQAVAAFQRASRLRSQTIRARSSA